MIQCVPIPETGVDKNTMTKINVLDREVTVVMQNNEDYICIMDIARYKDPDRTDYLIQNWLRNRNALQDSLESKGKYSWQ
jgi:PHD/YefM family antitoxin component YafN of YafNO toxin-antitoxin module